MKHLKGTNTYKASNVSYNPETMKAYSYDWWQFTANINGHIVFNSYKYSPSTQRHQSNVLSLMERLGHSPSIIIDVPSGLQVHNWKLSAISHYNDKIQSIVAAMVKGRKAKNEERVKEIVFLKAQIDVINSL